METTKRDIGAEIRSANEKFMDTFAKGDAAGVASLYTEDGMLLPAGMESIKGKQGVEHFWQGVMGMGIKQVRLDTIEIDQGENMTAELGNYTLSGEDGKPVDKGKYIVVWKKEGGEWRLHKDIWNTSLVTT